MDKLFLAALIVLLGACAAPIKTTLSPPNINLWQQHLRQVQTIEAWNIHGRIAIQNRDNGGQADLFWQQTNSQYYDIKLIAPFGGGSSHLQGRPSGVVLITSDGQRVAAQNADSLLEQVQGWRFPVGALSYWLLGVPAPTSKAQLISWNAQSLLHVMHQDGWRVELRRYKNVADKTLPGKIFISRLDDEEVEVRLVIRQWSLADDQSAGIENIPSND
jgi:outer membrane lipoprotein LolB